MKGPEFVMWIVLIGGLLYLALTDYFEDDDDDAS